MAREDREEWLLAVGREEASGKKKGRSEEREQKLKEVAQKGTKMFSR